MTSEEYGQYIDDFELGADVMPGESLTEYIERRRREFESKADGGSIGIEVLFGPKREDFNIGGNVKKNQPYDPRASIMDYAAALDKVGGGTQAQKSQSLTDYGKNILAGLDTSTLNPATRSLAASYGVGKPISKFEDLGPGVGQALQGAIMRTLQDPRAEGISLKNIPVSSYTSYFGDRGAANTQGIFQTGYNSILDQARDMTAALAGDPSAIARTTLGRFNVDIDPEARTGLIRDRYDFSKQMPGSTPYDLNIALPQKFVDEILSSPEYQKITGYKPPQTRTPLSESDFYSQFYGVPYKGFENKFFKTVQKGDPNYDAIRAASSAGSFSDLVDRGIIQAYTGPTDYKNYLSTFADGGRVPMVSGGALKGLMNLFKRGGDDAVDLVKQEEIFREGPITTKFLEDVDDKLIKKFVRTRDTKGPGSYGMYDSFDDMPAGLKAAEIIKRFVDRKTGKINYEDAEFFIGKKLKGDETIDELIDIAISEPIGMGKGPFKDFEEYVLNPAKKADGGRVGLFMGGPALEGQALSIYNSMNAYGFSDQEIADALSARGLYTAPGSGTTQPEQVTGIIGSQLNQGGDDKPMIQPFRQDPRVGAAFEAYQRNQGLKAMGIEDPFADEISLQGAYYGDMPNVNLKPGSQSMMGKIKSGIGQVMNFPLVKGMSLMSPFGLLKQGITAFKDVLPVNQRAIAENVAGNMGIAVDNIGRIVNTGDYQDPSNVMAGYNLNQMTDETFDKRIDRTSKTLSEKYGLSDQQIQGILEGTLTDAELNAINAKAIMPGTNKTTNLIKQLRSINIAKDRNKFIQDIAKKEAERQEQIKLQKKLEAAKAKQITTAPTQLGGGDGQSGGNYAGGAAFAAANPYGGSGTMDDLGADSFYKDGGLATMFTRRR